MTAGEVRIEGLDEFNAKMDRLGNPKFLKSALEDCAKEMLAVARMNVPVDTSNLRSSLNTEIEQKEGESSVSLGTSVHYARYVEYGTGNPGRETAGNKYPADGITFTTKSHWMYTDKEGNVHFSRGQSAHPYLRPALYDNEKRFREILGAGVNKDLIK